MSLAVRARAFLELARPANVVTAFADILAGFAAAGGTGLLWTGEGVHTSDLGLLLLATAGLYAGGVVFNDVFDAHLDADERPERPIPSGRVSRSAASLFGALLLVGGVVAAAFVHPASLAVATLVAVGALVYDAAGKHHPLLGPLNMGACRGGNLLLGATVVPTALGEIWYIVLIPVAYIAAVTAVSRGEVHGGARSTGAWAVALVTAVVGALLLLGLRLDYRIVRALPFLALFAALVYPPFIRAAVQPSPSRVRSAVKAGVLSLVAINATLASGFGGWWAGVAVILLLPLSVGLARLFSVT